MPPVRLLWQACFYHHTGRRDIGGSGRRWAQKLFSLGAGHGSIFELAIEKESVRDLFKEIGRFNPSRPGGYYVYHIL
jgi:hypothetical protein